MGASNVFSEYLDEIGELLIMEKLNGGKLCEIGASNLIANHNETLQRLADQSGGKLSEDETRDAFAKFVVEAREAVRSARQCVLQGKTNRQSRIDRGKQLAAARKGNPGSVIL